MRCEPSKCDPTKVASGARVSIALAGVGRTGLGARLDSCIEA